MKIDFSFPPNIKDILKVIPESAIAKAIFTYGDTIHNPSQGSIDEPLLIHEAQHSIQQDAVGGPAKWWKRWLSEPKFRLAQEMEAYGLQFRRYCELNKDRNKRAMFLMKIATDLSSAQYGKVITLVEARNEIKRYYNLDRD